MKIEKLRRLKGKSLFNGAAVFHHVALALTEPIKPISSLLISIFMLLLCIITVTTLRANVFLQSMLHVSPAVLCPLFSLLCNKQQMFGCSAVASL